MPRTSKFTGPLLGVLGLLLGALALGTPFLAGNLGYFILGVSILGFGLLQNMTGFVGHDPELAGTWFSRGGSSMVTGLLLIAMPKMTFAALALLLGLSWGVSGVSTFVTAFRGQRGGLWSLIDGLINLALGVAIALQWPIDGFVSVGIALGLRYAASGWSILLGAAAAPAGTPAEAAAHHPDPRLGLPPHPYLGTAKEEMARELTYRASSDRVWCAVFLLTFFAIHVARMDTEWNLVGLLSPAGAVVGDIFWAILLAYGVVAPFSVTWRTLTRRFEFRAWTWYLAIRDRGQASGVRARLVHGWLMRRMRGALRREQAQGSPTAALGWAMQTCLPVAAILLAVAPLWGVSWFFNTETWVTGAWQMWAEQRTDDWRVEMVNGVRKEYENAGQKSDFLQVSPPGVADASDFSFVVIGDTGEGDASQHILRDQLLLLGQKPQVRFLVVASDVIYPSGSMKDYEPKFYLPFKGFHRPIYAVPGNHDWYDALEAFTANFLEPKAARAALRARREADLRLTTTTEARIDAMVADAARWRQEYQLQVGLQRAPYFEIHSERFSLIVVDTGILRRVDEDQIRWLEEALGRSRGKFTLVILGHPLYAAGHYQGANDADFARIHDLLRKHEVDVVMAGDTHDFEYYKEGYERGGQSRSMYHFVNGGGGAYLSIGTALSWPRRPATTECGFYPRADALTAHLDASTPAWKQPLWFWVKRLHAWPSSPEAVASAFDYDRAPFFQSFMEIHVEGSTDRVRCWLYGANGRLRWRDLHVQDDRIPQGQSADDSVEFSFPLRPRRGK